MQSKERKSRYHTGPGRFSCLCRTDLQWAASGCILFFKPLADFKEAGLHDNAFESGEEKKLKTQNFFQFIQNKNTHRIMKI